MIKDKTVNIETDVHTELRIHCAKTKCTIGDFTQDAIREKIGREPLDRE